MDSDDSQEGTGRVLGEEWFPVGEISVESMRERSASSALPPHYFLHVWFARRPLAASRAAIAASLLPENADRQRFLSLQGIPPETDIVSIYQEFLRAKAEKRKIDSPFSWTRAFKCTPSSDLTQSLKLMAKRTADSSPLILDPFSGGGSIPLEAIRLGLDVVAND